MNIEDYISSGILDEYVLGLTNAEESEAVAKSATLYPEVAAYIEECRAALYQYTYAHNNEVVKAEKDKVWESIQAFEKSQEVTHENTVDHSLAQPVLSVKSKQKPLNYLMAASVALLVGSGVANLVLWNKNKDQENAIAGLKSYQQSKEVEIASNKEILSEYQQYSEMSSSPAVVKVKLEGVPGHENTSALVLWDSKTKDVYISLNNLPAPPTDKQYQLWAIVDGKPVDAGIFDPGTPIKQLKNIERAEMFAVTLENKGGSASPTMEQMYVAGKT